MKSYVTVTLVLPEGLWERIVAVAPNREQTPEQFIRDASADGIEIYVEAEERNPTIKVPCSRCGVPIFICSDDPLAICNDCWKKAKAEAEN